MTKKDDLREKKVLILGVGNILLRDEGFGVASVNYLEQHYLWPGNVRLLDGGTSGLMLMPEIMDCELLFVLDVVLGGDEPGSIYLLQGEDLRKSLSFRDSMHQTDLVDTLIHCELAGFRPKAVVFGIEPLDWQDLGTELSPALGSRLELFCRKFVEYLGRDFGIKAREKAAGE